MRRKIVLVVPEYPPHSVGGGGVAYRSLALALRGLGNDVRILAGDYTGQTATTWDDDLEVRRFALLPFPRRFAFLNGYMPPYPTAALREAVASLTDDDIVHVHGTFLGFSDAVALSLARRSRAYFLTNHGYPHRPRQMGSPIRQILQAYERLIVRPVVLGARRVSAISEFCASDGPLALRHVDIIPNGIDMPQNAPEAAANRTASALLFVGRLQRDKGVAVLLRALAESPGFTLKAIGPDGGELKMLAKLAHDLGLSDRVTFAGPEERETVLHEMRSAYAVVMPSLNEPFGLVGLEAMANGALLICSDTGGQRAYAATNNALLFKTGDHEELRDVLRTIPLPADEYSRIRTAAYNTALKNDWRCVAQRYCAWYGATVQEDG